MYSGRGGGEELSLLNLELSNPLNGVKVPFIQLLLLVADDRLAVGDFDVEGRDGRVVGAGGGAEGGDLFL
jgi:hypothetical protein